MNITGAVRDKRGGNLYFDWRKFSLERGTDHLSLTQKAIFRKVRGQDSRRGKGRKIREFKREGEKHLLDWPRKKNGPLSEEKRRGREDTAEERGEGTHF